MLSLCVFLHLCVSEVENKTCIQACINLQDSKSQKKMIISIFKCMMHVSKLDSKQDTTNNDIKIGTSINPQLKQF